MDTQKQVEWLELGQKLSNEGVDMDQLASTIQMLTGTARPAPVPVLPALTRTYHRKAEKNIRRNGRVKNTTPHARNHYDPVCDKQMGAGYTTHMRKHEKNGEAKVVEGEWVKV